MICGPPGTLLVRVLRRVDIVIHIVIHVVVRIVILERIRLNTLLDSIIVANSLKWVMANSVDAWNGACFN